MNMLTPGIPEFDELIKKAAGLRGKGLYDEAMNLIEPRLPEMGEDGLKQAYLELVYAAKLKGDTAKTEEYQAKLRGIDPNMPAAQPDS